MSDRDLKKLLVIGYRESMAKVALVEDFPRKEFWSGRADAYAEMYYTMFNQPIMKEIDNEL